MRKDLRQIQQHIVLEAYSEAYSILSKIDQDDLYIKGTYSLLIYLYNQIEPHISNNDLIGLRAKLGRVYYRNGDCNLAEKYLRLAVEDDTDWQLFALSVLGGLLTDLKKKEAALEVLNRTIDIAKTKGNEQIEAGTMVRKARILKDEMYIKEAIEMAEKNRRGESDNNWEADIDRDLHIWRGYLGMMMVDKGEGEEGKDMVEKVLQYFIENKDKRYIKIFEEALDSK